MAITVEIPSFQSLVWNCGWVKTWQSTQCPESVGGRSWDEHPVPAMLAFSGWWFIYGLYMVYMADIWLVYG